MNERLELAIENRVAYAPTPLSPWNVVTVDKDGVQSPYYERSLTKFDELVEQHRATKPEWLVNAVHSALMHSHASRCDYNFNAHQEQLRSSQGQSLPELPAELMRRAQNGTASIHDLLLMHDMKVGLPSVELAKQSHPFSWDTVKMDTAVNMAISTYDPNVRWMDRAADRRYTFYRAVPEGEPAQGLVIVRKRNIAQMYAANTIVKRSSFILRLDEDLPCPLSELKQMFDAPDTSQNQQHPLQSEIIAQLLARGQEEKAIEFAARVNAQCTPHYQNTIGQYLADNGSALEAGIQSHAPWLTPTATSYYVRTARYIPPKNTPGLNTEPKPYFSNIT